MLPAYFASSFENRRLLVAMTFLFAAGIATVILPIAMGASALQQLLTTQHTAIYVTGGLLMLALAIYVLLCARACLGDRPLQRGLLVLAGAGTRGSLRLRHGSPLVRHRAALGSLRLACEPAVPPSRIHLAAGSFHTHAHSNEPGQRHLARAYWRRHAGDRAGLPFHATIGWLADTTVRRLAAHGPAHDQRPRLDSELGGRAHLPCPPRSACLVRSATTRGTGRQQQGTSALNRNERTSRNGRSTSHTGGAS